MRILITILFIAISWPVFSGEYIPQKGYSPEPLKSPVFDYAHVIVDATMFNNWLNTNHSKLNVETMKGPREHLYYLLSSYVSELYKRDQVILPKEHDLILEILFSWSERLGVYGGSLVYNQIKNKKMKSMPELMKVPKNFNLSLENDLYLLTSPSNIWSVKFPYYFMIGTISDFKATNGMQTQVASISTGASKDSSKAGRSQGTLMLIYSPTSDFDTFSKFWLRQLALAPDAKSTDLGIKNLNSISTYDKDSLLHKEITLWPTETGSFAVAYLGMDGTYQTNRQHFLDFLNQVNVRQAITANPSFKRDALKRAP